MAAPVQNTNDGTTLGTSEVIADEYIDPILGCRVITALLGTPYKMPRSKIAVGAYGQDWGDAAPTTPLDVESKNERSVLEKMMLQQQLESVATMQRYSQETVSLVDARGSFLSNRGVR